MKKYILLIFIIICMPRCTNEVWRGIPTDENSPAPPPVTDIQVVPTPGGAKISYTLPKNDNLLYIMAEYTLKGNIIQKKASYYSNYLEIEGFPDTNDYNIKIYSVSRDGVRSLPADVTITPLPPPVISIFESITMEPTFGGVRVNFVNESEAEIKLSVITTDSVGDFYTYDTYYTKRKDGAFAVRGFEVEPRRFGLYVLDRWNNYSDTVYADLTPWFEEQLDKSRFRPLHLPTDTYDPHPNADYHMGKLWDDIWGTTTMAFHTRPNTGIPQWFTFDLGVKSSLSRFKFYHRLASSNATAADGQYAAGDPRVFEIYGSNAPNPDGSWDSWTLLGTFESIKPSGQESGWTTEDVQYAVHDGEDFDFPVLEEEGYRYLRVRIVELWGNVTYMYIGEMTFWGKALEE